jgi:hypothetical protein
MCFRSEMFCCAYQKVIIRPQALQFSTDYFQVQKAVALAQRRSSRLQWTTSELWLWVTSAAADSGRERSAAVSEVSTRHTARLSCDSYSRSDRARPMDEAQLVRAVRLSPLPSAVYAYNRHLAMDPVTTTCQQALSRVDHTMTSFIVKRSDFADRAHSHCSVGKRRLSPW